MFSEVIGAGESENSEAFAYNKSVVKRGEILGGSGPLQFDL